MNTFENLVENGIHPVNAQRMLDDYSSKIGTMNGIYQIADITYDFEHKGRDVILKCSLCGREIHRMLIKNKNKWCELIKHCPCEKHAEEEERKRQLEIKKQEEQERILHDGKSMVGGTYGDYEIMDFQFAGNKPFFTLKCVKCGDIVTGSYQRVKINAKTYSKCHKHGNPVKFYESYIGKKKNFLKVIGITRNDKSRRMFVCECDCGNIKLIEPAIWEQGIVKSCGCKHKELSSKNTITHGHSGDRLYKVYGGMKQRCYNPNNIAYRNYGGRGIRICDEWLDDFMNFYKWAMENGYDYNAEFGECTIDRIDVNGNYEPSNCRWADVTTQANNRRPINECKNRKAKIITINEDSKTLKEWCLQFNTSEQAVYYRINKLGMTFEQALKTPKMTLGRPKKEVINT